MKTALKEAALALCGGCVYVCVELLWRGHSHWTMAVAGGICFVLIGCINEFFPWDMALLSQGVLGAGIVTVIEFLSGCILNIGLGLHIWDYSNQPYNVLGQICLLFSILWIPLAIAGVVLDDWLRYWLFGEKKPKYKIF